MPRLTKKIVDAADAQAKPYFLWCSELPGFGVRVFPTGRRVYYADYRNADGVRKRLSIGRHGTLTADSARKLALATLGDVVRGADPAEVRAARRKAITVEELCNDYLTAAERGLIIGKRGQPKKPSTLATDRGRIARHIKPLLGRKLVADLSRADVARFIADVTTGKTATVEKSEKLRGKAVVEGGRGTATRTTGLLGGILSYAVTLGIIDSNPATGVRRPADESRKRHLSDEEFGRLGAALAEAAADVETWQAIAAVWLLALTGCRLDEVLGLRWVEVDEAGSCLRLEDSKTGASVRPVGSAVFKRLAEIERGGEFVLPAIRGVGSFGGWPGAWRRLASRAGLDGVTAHTFRHSFASVADGLGLTEPTIAALIGHSAGSTTRKYIHHVDAALVSAANRVAIEIERLMFTNSSAS